MNHLQHRIEVWEQKQATLDIMKEKMVLMADVADDEEDIVGLVSEAETDVYRIMKFDIDSFMAKQSQIDQYEEEQQQVNKKPKDDEEEEDDLSYVQKLAAKIDHYDNKMSNVMDNIRKEYKDITFFQCLLYCHLVVFSIAATVGYMFYTPPGSAKTANKKVQDNTLINIPVDFQSMKVPKKEIKKQLKSLVNSEKDTKESML